jgi:zinc resistance-associated protein
MSVGFIAGSAWACYWGGNSGNSGWGHDSNYYGNQSSNYQNFMNDSASIREQIAAKHGEYNALMAQQNPDPKRAAKLQEEIAKLNNEIQQKGQKYNVDSWGGNRPASPNYHQYCNYRGCW